ncbi:DUF892 family protein [Rhizobiaceae sp. 2RAB30]
MTAARFLGEEEIARVCDQSLREEIAMAEWLENNLPRTTEEFLSRVSADSDAAKR